MPIGLRYRREYLIFILAMLCCPILAICLEEEIPPFDVEQFLNGPDHSDIPLKFATYGPHLTMQQRYIVGAYARIQKSRLPHTSAAELHFVLKIGDAENRWIAGKYTRIQIKRGQNELEEDVNYSCGFYLRPGRYTVALIVYDADSKQASVQRKRLKVALLNKDPLPQLDRDLPGVEFTAESPLDYAQRFPNVTNHLDDYTTLSSMDDFSNRETRGRQDYNLGHGKEWLPVNSSHPITIDIIADVSSDYDNNERLSPLNRFFGRGVKSSDILRIASVLSHLRLQNGCIRISIMDALRTETFFDRENAADFDWTRAGERLSKQNAATIAVSNLSSQDQAPAYLNGKIKAILESDSCPSAGESAARIVIFLGRDVEFPGSNVKVEPLEPPNPAPARFFYFQVTEGVYKNDDILKILKLVKPQKFVILDSFMFRKSLAAVITSLEKLK